MRALTVHPKQSGSLKLREVPEPPVSDGPVLVETLVIGVCGTDKEIIRGEYGWAPSGSEYLILGHESLGRVLEAPAESGLRSGDLVVGIVRRPDPVPCPSCAHGEWDMCSNGHYTERGIKERHGFGSERYRSHAKYVVKIDPALGLPGVLVETTSVVAKAWDHIDRIGARAYWSPKVLLVTGAGPVGLMAALIGSQRGLDVHLLDHNKTGPKPGLAKALGAAYHTSAIRELGFHPDIVIECTGVGTLVLDAMAITAPSGIVCLTGVSSGQRVLNLDVASFNRAMVLENDVVFGSVNANRRHYESAAEALHRADPKWLNRIISRQVPLERSQEAYSKQPVDVKTVVEFKSL